MACNFLLRPLLVAISVCMALSLHAQTPSVSSDSTSFAWVLNHIPYDIDILRTEENSLISARSGNLFATYFFNEGTLYSIELTKNYEKTRKAQESYDGCIDYILSTGAVSLQFAEDSTEKRVIAIGNGRVYRLTMHTTNKDNIDVTLASKFVNRAPAAALEWPDELELKAEAKK